MKFEMMEDRALEWAKKITKITMEKRFNLYTVAIRYIVYILMCSWWRETDVCMEVNIEL